VNFFVAFPQVLTLGLCFILPENICSLDAWHGRGDNPAMTKRKEYTLYAAAMVATLLNEIATAYGIEMLTLLPLLLAVVFVGFWALDVK
jgi:hypothetical protein